MNIRHSGGHVTFAWTDALNSRGGRAMQKKRSRDQLPAEVKGHEVHEKPKCPGSRLGIWL